MIQTFGTELRRIRTKQGVSLRSLSELVHYSKGYLSRVETGGRAPTIELARRCDDVLGAGGSLREVYLVGEAAGTSMPAVPASALPTPATELIGRHAELRRLDAMISPNRPVLCVLNGMAGVGKSTLALHWARRVQSRFPDGARYIDLHETVQSELDLTTRCLMALHPGSQLPPTSGERRAMLRRELAGRTLTVIDHLPVAAQLPGLASDVPGSMLLATSRDRSITFDASHVAVLDVLRPDEAVELVAHLIGSERQRAEPEATRQLVELCCLLPLAVRSAARQLAARPRWSIASFVERLGDSGDELTVLNLNGGAVRAALSESFRQLPPDAARAFALTARMGEPDLTAPSAARALGADVRTAEQLLDVLVDGSLLETPAPGRYHFHDVVRTYASTLL